ncbi:MAG: hypothetical protein WB567_08935 [Terracidiphilus sp.]
MPSANSRISTDAGVSQAESWAVIACCMAASMAAIIWSWRHDAMLNYGDAVAHLHIARRVFDSRTPRFSQLGSVWLPLPHILLIPFVQNYQWWATGLAGVIPSALAYIAACAGIYRLARHFVSRSASALALAFFALNPNLLYLQTTAMTEPLFLCEMIWIVVFLVEWRDALNAESESAGRSPHLGQSRSPGRLSPIAASFQNSLRAESSLPHHRGAWLGDPTAQRSASRSIFDTPSSRFMAAIAAVLVAAIFTRYDGWIIAFLVWCGIGIALWSHRRLDSPAFWLLTLPVVAAPIFWFVYNSVCFGDWLYFARGPYSAQAIELRTSTPGAWPPHPGWHNLWVSLLFYLKVSQLDSIAAAATGNKAANIVLALAALGFIAVCLAQRAPAARRIFSWVFLLWLPVPFYAWSVAYGSVPIFFHNWWPYTLYNTRYGIELLPALALGFGFAAHSVLRLLHAPHLPRILSRLAAGTIASVLAFTLFFALAGFNCVELLRNRAFVYEESTKNLEARLPYDEAIPPVIQDLLSLLPHAPVLMNTSAYPEIVAYTGIPLRQTINESDLEIFRAALADPAGHAAVIVCFQGDDIDNAVHMNPQNLAVAAHFTANTQPPAVVYFSTKWMDRSPYMKLPKLTGPLLKDLSPPSTDAVPVSPNH